MLQAAFLEKEPLVVLASIFELLAKLLAAYATATNWRDETYVFSSIEARATQVSNPQVLEALRAQKKLESFMIHSKTTLFWKHYVTNQQKQGKHPYIRLSDIYFRHNFWSTK